MIPFKKRGLYQAMQNILVGFGAVLGASLGGVIVDSIGWRWCFLLQVPVSIFALIVGYKVLENPEHTVMKLHPKNRIRSAIRHVDLSGSLLLVIGLVVQLLGLSFGGNEYPWGSGPVVGTLVVSALLLAGFVSVEANTQAIPMIPLRMLKGWQPTVVQLTNVFVGMASYAVSIPYPPRLRVANPSAVHVHDSTVLSGCSWRLPIHCWHAVDCSSLGNTHRRGHCRCNDAARLPTVPKCSYRDGADAPRESPRVYDGIGRESLAGIRVSRARQPRTRPNKPQRAV